MNRVSPPSQACGSSVQSLAPTKGHLWKLCHCREDRHHTHCLFLLGYKHLLTPHQFGAPPLPICSVRWRCLQAKGAAEASSRPESWYQGNDSHDHNLITIAVNQHWLSIYFFAMQYAKPFTPRISCQLQDNSEARCCY